MLNPLPINTPKFFGTETCHILDNVIIGNYFSEVYFFNLKSNQIEKKITFDDIIRKTLLNENKNKLIIYIECCSYNRFYLYDIEKSQLTEIIVEIFPDEIIVFGSNFIVISDNSNKKDHYIRILNSQKLITNKKSLTINTKDITKIKNDSSSFPITNIIISENDTLIVVCNIKYMYWYDNNNNSKSSYFIQNSIKEMKFNPKGNILLTVENKYIKLYDRYTHECINTIIKAPCPYIKSISFLTNTVFICDNYDFSEEFNKEIRSSIMSINGHTFDNIFDNVRPISNPENNILLLSNKTKQLQGYTIYNKKFITTCLLSLRCHGVIPDARNEIMKQFGVLNDKFELNEIYKEHKIEILVEDTGISGRTMAGF